jgi:hypothetical protein
MNITYIYEIGLYDEDKIHIEAHAQDEYGVFSDTDAVECSKSLLEDVGFEALTTVVMKRCVFWGVKHCTPTKSEVSEERIAPIFKVEEEAKQETGMKQAASRARHEYVPPKRRLSFTEVQSVIFQRTGLLVENIVTWLVRVVTRIALVTGFIEHLHSSLQVTTTVSLNYTL